MKKLSFFHTPFKISFLEYLQILCIYLTYANAIIYNCLYLG